jgi:hypothetical protein
MLTCVSLAAWLLAERLASGALRRLMDGDAPRPLLSWLLLGADGPALRRRRHESSLDCHSHWPGCVRKPCAEGRIGRAGARRRHDWRGCREMGLDFTAIRRLQNFVMRRRHTPAPVRRGAGPGCLTITRQIVDAALKLSSWRRFPVFRVEAIDGQALFLGEDAITLSNHMLASRLELAIF